MYYNWLALHTGLCSAVLPVHGNICIFRNLSCLDPQYLYNFGLNRIEALFVQESQSVKYCSPNPITERPSNKIYTPPSVYLATRQARRCDSRDWKKSAMIKVGTSVST